MDFFYLASNGVYLIPPETDDRMGFLTTNILTMFVLLALIVEMIPTPATKEDFPLVMTIYECSVGLFIIQYLVVLFTHQMATWKDEMKPWIQRVAGINVDYTKCYAMPDHNDQKGNDSETEALFNAIFELKLIRFLLCKQSQNHDEMRLVFILFLKINLSIS